METQTKFRFSAHWSDELGDAIRQNCTEPYIIRFGALGGMYTECATNATWVAGSFSLSHCCMWLLAYTINQGIDSHLEVVSFTLDGRTLTIEPESVPVLVRRLLTCDDGELSDESCSIACGICCTLGIELV